MRNVTITMSSGKQHHVLDVTLESVESLLKGIYDVGFTGPITLGDGKTVVNAAFIESLEVPEE